MRFGAWTLLSASALVAAAPAAGATLHAQRLGDSQSYSEEGLRWPVAVGPDGRAVAVVKDGDLVRVRWAERGRPFGAARSVPLSTEAETLTAAAGVGFAVAAWTQFDHTLNPAPHLREDPCCRRLRAALVERDGTTTRPRTLSSPNANVQWIHTAVHGRRVALAWDDLRGARTSIATRGHVFGRPVTVSTMPESSLLGVTLPRKTPHVFLLRGYNTPWRVIETWRRRGRSEQRTLGLLGNSPTEPTTLTWAIAPSGRMLLAYEELHTRTRTRRLVVVTRAPGHRLRARRVALPWFPRPQTSVALAPSGRGVVASSIGYRALLLRNVDTRGRVGPGRAVNAGARIGATALATTSSGAGLLAVSGFEDSSPDVSWEELLAWPLRDGSRPKGRRTVVPRSARVVQRIRATADGRVVWDEAGGTFAALVAP